MTSVTPVAEILGISVACHEGNDAMRNILSIARAQEADAGTASK